MENHNYDTPPETKFSLGGQEYRWAYSTNAVIRLEAALGDDAIEQLRMLQPPQNGEPPQFGKRLAVLRALVWAGIDEAPEMTVEKVGGMLRPNDITDLSLSLLECMARGLGKNPTTAATATAASAAGPDAAVSA